MTPDEDSMQKQLKENAFKWNEWIQCLAVYSIFPRKNTVIAGMIR